ncbi:hypothetical protein PCASD_15811 [Puccinia coronata f. sp. avenae]|uniref:Uncharacterized protein n=1 Tax=Puccinia coronata f. sp. avenae TaxID=200324 RepID=A0A2N5SNP4_9BASI|nr:hypothetical protein PCASD_15811 [Puccinia coronata f. sp. avenae]
MPSAAKSQVIPHRTGPGVRNQSSKGLRSLEAAQYEKLEDRLAELEKCFELSNDQIAKRLELESSAVGPVLNDLKARLERSEEKTNLLEKRIEELLSNRESNPEGLETRIANLENTQMSLGSQLSIFQNERSPLAHKTLLELDQVISKLQTEVSNNHDSIRRLEGIQDNFELFHKAMSKNLADLKASLPVYSQDNELQVMSLQNTDICGDVDVAMVPFHGGPVATKLAQDTNENYPLKLGNRLEELQNDISSLKAITFDNKQLSVVMHDELIKHRNYIDQLKTMEETLLQKIPNPETLKTQTKRWISEKMAAINPAIEKIQLISRHQSDIKCELEALKKRVPDFSNDTEESWRIKSNSQQLMEVNSSCVDVNLCEDGKESISALKQKIYSELKVQQQSIFSSLESLKQWLVRHQHETLKPIVAGATRFETQLEAHKNALDSLRLVQTTNGLEIDAMDRKNSDYQSETSSQIELLFKSYESISQAQTAVLNDVAVLKKSSPDLSDHVPIKKKVHLIVENVDKEDSQLSELTHQLKTLKTSTIKPSSHPSQVSPPTSPVTHHDQPTLEESTTNLDHLSHGLAMEEKMAASDEEESSLEYAPSTFYRNQDEDEGLELPERVRNVATSSSPDHPHLHLEPTGSKSNSSRPESLAFINPNLSDRSSSDSASPHQVNSRKKVLEKSLHENVRTRHETDLEDGDDDVPTPKSRSIMNHTPARKRRENKPDNNQCFVTKKKESLRAQRASMDTEAKEDDRLLGQAIQAHIRILGGLPRAKKAFLPSPDNDQLNKLPDLPGNSSKLGTSSPYHIPAKKVNQTWDPNEEMGQDFSAYCLRRARQYGLPFFGLSISKDNSKAVEWNRRTIAFCVDTFTQAVTANDYTSYLRSGYELDDERVEEIVEKSLQYRLCEMNKHSKSIQNAKGKQRRSATNSSNDASDTDDAAGTKQDIEKQNDRRQARCVALAKRRLGITRMVEIFSPISNLFSDERLCSSDESLPNKADEARIRHAPVWRSQKATALIEYVDDCGRKILNEGPKRSGRKPAKRIDLGARAPQGGLKSTPCNLPEDCYNPMWLGTQTLKQRKELDMKPPIFTTRIGKLLKKL